MKLTLANKVGLLGLGFTASTVLWDPFNRMSIEADRKLYKAFVISASATALTGLAGSGDPRPAARWLNRSVVVVCAACLATFAWIGGEIAYDCYEEEEATKTEQE